MDGEGPGRVRPARYFFDVHAAKKVIELYSRLRARTPAEGFSGVLRVKKQGAEVQKIFLDKRRQMCYFIKNR